MFSRARRLVPLALVALTLVALAPTASAADSTTEAAIVAAEQGAHTLGNKRRAEHGLVALQWDDRLAAIARDRAEYMAKTGRFSHTEADGSNVFDRISESGITWYAAGEIIAWNTAGDLQYSAAFAMKQWMESSGHRAIVLSSGYNYVGFGLAISPTTNKRYWAGVYMKGPDRTPGYTRIQSTKLVTVDSTRAKLTLDWTANDIKLQVLTSGIRYYQVQSRPAGTTSWYSHPTTTESVATVSVGRGRTYEFRVAVRDRAGNWSPWKTVTVTT